MRLFCVEPFLHGVKLAIRQSNYGLAFYDAGYLTLHPQRSPLPDSLGTRPFRVEFVLATSLTTVLRTGSGQVGPNNVEHLDAALPRFFFGPT